MAAGTMILPSPLIPFQNPDKTDARGVDYRRLRCGLEHRSSAIGRVDAKTFQFTAGGRSTINNHLLTAAKIRDVMNDEA